jgi:hypothetical protein
MKGLIRGRRGRKRFFRWKEKREKERMLCFKKRKQKLTEDF